MSQSAGYATLTSSRREVDLTVCLRNNFFLVCRNWGLIGWIWGDLWVFLHKRHHKCLKFKVYVGQTRVDWLTILKNLCWRKISNSSKKKFFGMPQLRVDWLIYKFYSRLLKIHNAKFQNGCVAKRQLKGWHCFFFNFLKSLVSFLDILILGKVCRFLELTCWLWIFSQALEFLKNLKCQI